jgi:DNA polymerase I
VRIIDTPDGSLRVVSTLSDASDLWTWMQGQSHQVLGLDSETSATNSPWDKNYKLRTVQISDATTPWVIQAERQEIQENNVIATIINQHSYWTGWFTENDIRFIECGAPGSFRFGQRDPHFADGQVLLAYYDPRTVTTASKKENIDPRIRLPRDLKSTSARLLNTSTLVDAERAMHLRWHELAPKGHRTPKKMKKWGFANISDDDPIYLRYAGLDALHTCRLWHVMSTELKRRGQWWAVCNDLRIQWHYDWMTFRGILVDGPYVRWLNDQLLKTVNDHAALLTKYGVRPSAMGPSISKAFNDLKIVSPKPTASGGQCWDKTVLPDIAAQGGPGGELAQTLIDVRKASKYRSTYVQPMLNCLEQDGRLHPSLRAIGTISSRNAAARPPLQQLPKKDPRVRAATCAQYGWVVIPADLKQGEPRVMAALSGDLNLKRDLLEGDLYNKLASLTYGPEFNPAEGKNPSTASYILRQKPKFGFLAWTYGCKAKKLVDLLSTNFFKMTTLQASIAISQWERAYPDLVRFRDRMNRQRAVTLESGWVAPLWDRYYVDHEGVHCGPKPSRLGLNYPTQGTQRHIFTLAIHWLIDNGWSWALWWVMHDELLLCVPEHMAAAAAAALKTAMTMVFRGMPIECDVDEPPYGRTWMPQPTEFDPTDLPEVDDDDE